MTILSSSSYEYIDPDGSATIEPYQFKPMNDADGQDSASLGDDDDDPRKQYSAWKHSLLSYSTFFTLTLGAFISSRGTAESAQQ